MDRISPVGHMAYVFFKHKFQVYNITIWCMFTYKVSLPKCIVIIHHPTIDTLYLFLPLTPFSSGNHQSNLHHIYEFVFVLFFCLFCFVIFLIFHMSEIIQYIFLHLIYFT